MIELLAGPLINDATSQESLAAAGSPGSTPRRGELAIAFDPLILGGETARNVDRAESLFAAIESQGARLPSDRRYRARARNVARNAVTIPEQLYQDRASSESAPAYAATIHKSQGSEYPAVIIPVLTQHYAMLQRNLLYTGVTRGKRLVVLVGQTKAIAIAVRNVSGRRRWSKLDEWLRRGATRASFTTPELG
jgi:hypothetical protein